MPPLALPQNRGEATTAKAEALLNSPGHGDFRAVTGQAIALTVNPHSTGAIINLENAASQRAKRAAHLSGDGDFLTGVASRVTINFFNAGPGRAASQKQDSANHQHCCQNSCAYFHRHPPCQFSIANRASLQTLRAT